MLKLLLDVLQLIIVIPFQKFLAPEEEFWHKNWTVSCDGAGQFEILGMIKKVSEIRHRV